MLVQKECGLGGKRKVCDHGRRLCETSAPQQRDPCKELPVSKAHRPLPWQDVLPQADLAAEVTALIAHVPGDVGTRPANYSNYSSLPSGAGRFNLGMALNQACDTDQRIRL